jgi:hypothetical protein
VAPLVAASARTRVVLASPVVDIGIVTRYTVGTMSMEEVPRNNSERPFARPENEALTERGFVPGATITLIREVPYEVWQHLAEWMQVPVAEAPDILRAYTFSIMGFSKGKVQLFIEGVRGALNLYIPEGDLLAGFEVIAGDDKATL